MPHLPTLPHLPHLPQLTRHPVVLERVPWTDPRAEALRQDMDAEMTELYAHVTNSSSPEQIAEVDAALAVDPAEIVTSVLAIDEFGAAIGHLAVRPYREAFEVKKVFVAPRARGRGISKQLMAEAEVIALENSVTILILQTGDLQAEAIALYLRCGYEAIPVYEPYVVMANALCFKKVLF